MRTVTVSFKNNAEDDEIYKWILNHSGYSGFIKDKLKKAMEEDKVPKMDFIPLQQILKHIED